MKPKASSELTLQSLAAHVLAWLTPFGDCAAALPRDHQTFSGAIFPSSPRSRWTFINAAARPALVPVAVRAGRKPEIRR